MLWAVEEAETLTGAELPRPVPKSADKLKGLAGLHKYLLHAVLALCPFVFWSVIKHLPAYLEADHRLAPTFALVHGYGVYYPPDSGPVLSTLYGPVTHPFYVPVTFAAAPSMAILFGTLLTVTAFYSAALLAIRRAAGRTWMKSWQLLGVTIGVVSLIGPLQSASSYIHADAPALAFGALAAAFAMREKRGSGQSQGAVLSSGFGVLSLFSKQNMLPLMLAPVIWWAIRNG
jgi:hypothetical protein